MPVVPQRIFFAEPVRSNIAQPCLRAGLIVTRNCMQRAAAGFEREVKLAEAAARAPLLDQVTDFSRPFRDLLFRHEQTIAAHDPRWKSHVLWRLNEQINVTCDPKLIELERELAAYPAPPASKGRPWEEADAVALPFELNLGGQLLSFITTTTVFGTPADVTLSELAVEAFFPANAETAAAMQAMAKARQN